MDPQPHHHHQRETMGERAFFTSYLLTSSLYRYRHYRLKRWLVYMLSLDLSMFKSSVMFCHPILADPTSPSVKKKVTQKSLKTARSPYTVKCQSRFLTKSSKVICQSVKVN